MPEEKKPQGSYNFQSYGLGNGNASLSIKGYIGNWINNSSNLIDELNAIKASKLTIDINSYGGDAIEGLAIYNALIKWKADNVAKIAVNIIGYAMSAASVIAMAGDEISMPENGYIMIHNPSIGGYEKDAWLAAFQDMLKGAEVDYQILDSLEKSYANVYAKRTGMAEDKVSGLMAAETWLRGTQAKEQGFATAVIDAMQIKEAFARVPQAYISSLKHLPEDLKGLFEASGDSDQQNFFNSINETMADVKKTVKDFLAGLKEKGFGITTKDASADINDVTDAIIANLEKEAAKEGTNTTEGTTTQTTTETTQAAGENTVEAEKKKVETTEGGITAEVKAAIEAAVKPLNEDLSKVKAENEELKKQLKTTAGAQSGRAGADAGAGEKVFPTDDEHADAMASYAKDRGLIKS